MPHPADLEGELAMSLSDSKSVERVRIGDTELFVELAERRGPQTVGAEHALSFDGVRESIEAISGELAETWARVQPAEATVQFGVSLTAKTGRLTALLVEGGGSASLTVSLKWVKTS